MKEDIRQTLEELTQLDGPSGYEHPVVEYLAEQFESAGASVKVDPMGNLFARRGDDTGEPHLMIAAHSDEIGAVIRFIDERGFLRFDPLGGVSAVLLVGRRVSVGGHPGIVGTKPGHLQTVEESHMAPPIDQLYIDVGAQSSEEVFDLGIKIGTPVVYDSPLQSFSNTDRMSGKAIDNRLGCAILLTLFRNIENKKISGRLTGLVTVQEEVGLRGAIVAAHHENPDYAVVIDTLPVGDTPDVSNERMTSFIGKGPVLVLVSRSGSGGHIGNLNLNRFLENAANRADVDLQYSTSVGYAVTDAGTIHLQQSGIPTVVLGLPRRYSHSPVCTFDINDAVGAINVLDSFIDDMSNHIELGFFES